MSAVRALPSAVGNNIPPPVASIVALHLVAAGLFGLLAVIDHSIQFPDLGTGTDAEFAVGLYANRNLGISIALLLALIAASRMALVGLMMARLITDLADLIAALTGGTGGAGALIGQLIFFGLLFASEIYVIRRLLGEERTAAA